MSLSNDEMVTSLMQTIESINKQLLNERKERKEEKNKLKDRITELEQEIEKSQSKKVSVETQEIMKKNSELELQNKQLLEQNNNLEKNLKEQKNEFEYLQKQKKSINEKLKDSEQKNIELENELKTEKVKNEEISKQLSSIKLEYSIELNRKSQEKGEIESLKKELEEKKNEINKKEEEYKKINEELQKEKSNNNDLLDYIKKEKSKREKEIEQEKEDREKMLKEEEKKRKEEEDKKKKLEKENSLFKDTEQIKLLTEIICDFIFKMLNSQYYLSIFDLINECCSKYDLLDFYSKLNPFDNNSIDDFLFQFFNNMQSYFSLKGDNAEVNDFLTQKNFKFGIEKTNVELLKKIAKLNIGTDKNLLEIYKERKGSFFKSLNISFDLFKKKYLAGANKITSIIQNDRPDFLRTEQKDRKDLIINMNEINMFKFYPLLKYQIKSMIPKLENLTIITSSPYIFIIYDISILCPNLKSLSINYVSDERLADSNINISILCDTFPILFNSLKNLETLTLKNIPIVGQNLIDFKNSILNTNISKLCLNNSTISKQKFETLYPYFKGNLKLTELDLSNHNCNIPALLNMSLFSGENNIISLNLSQNNFDENDIKILSQIILNNPKLKSLNISKNKLTQLSCSTIGFALNKTTTLEEINMSNCDINGETLVFLFTSKGSNSFKKIILDNNNLGDIGLMMLSHFIKNSNNLETISLKKVNGTDMGLSPIVSISLISKSPLKCIYIEENIINENLINDIIKNSEKYNEKGTVFNISSSYFKKNNEKYKCINLV